MSVQKFDDRFTYSNPALGAVNPTQLTETQLASLSPQLVEMANMVRGHSILTRNKTLREIYSTITQHADPRIALRLAAGKDSNGVPIFPNLDAVKAAMFGPATSNSDEFLDTQRNIFVQGVRRVSAALSAAFIIGQLAQIDEQFKHSVHLEKQALADLEEILSVTDLSAVPEQKESELELKALFFENKTMVLTQALRVEVFLPTAIGAAWQTVGIYNGEFTTARLVSDLADSINALTLQSQVSNLLAAPVLSAEMQTYRLDVSARRRDLEVSFEILSVKITQVSNATELLPFRWGVEISRLLPQTINSLILSVQLGRISAALQAERLERKPIVLYFRRLPTTPDGDVVDYDGSLMPGTTWQSGSLSFRISPTMDESLTVTVPWLSSTDPEEQDRLDSERFGQVATQLLNEMFEVKGPTRALGALIRNDNIATPDPMAALELIAFSATNPETWMILDVLELPLDVEMAVGNYQLPLTPFSNKPRSIRVEATYDSRLGITSQTANFGSGGGAKYVELRPPKRWEEIKTRHRRFLES